MASIDITAPVDLLQRTAKESPDKEPAEQLIERYGFLEQTIIKAAEEHIITPLPESAPDTRQAYSTSRLKVIVNRLYMLGYLDTDLVPNQLGDAYQNGVKAFQKDALGEVRLKPDGWVGEKTWSALQEMVSFEEPSNLTHWFTKGIPCHALMRAGLLRLYALGLAAKAPGHLARGAKLQPRIDALLKKGLAKFSGVTQILGWPESFSLQVPDLQTLGLLFDQDELVARLAGANVPRLFADRKAIKPFIVGMARIELWLTGYSIKPKGYTGTSDRMTHDNGLDLKNSSQLYKQLINYWNDFEQGSPELFEQLLNHNPKLRNQSIENRAKGLIRLGFPYFFAAVSAPVSTPDQAFSPGSEQVYAYLEKQAAKNRKDKTSIIREIWDHVHVIGARIWDGLKRAWHWFRSQIGKALKATKRFIQNISRVAYQYILKAYGNIRVLIKGVADSIRFFSISPLPMPRLQEMTEPAGLLFMHDHDFDFCACVDVMEDSHTVQAVSEYLENKALIFGLSCRLVGECLHHLMNMLKGIWKTTWIALLMALLKLYKSIKHRAPEIIALEQQQQGMLKPDQASLLAA